MGKLVGIAIQYNILPVLICMWLFDVLMCLIVRCIDAIDEAIMK